VTPEGRVKAQAKFLLDRYVEHGLWYYMPVSGGYGQHGIPDIIACFAGQFIAIECKSPKGKLTPLQQMQCGRLLTAGALVCIVNGEGDLYSLEAQLNLLLTKLAHETATVK